MLVTQWGQRVKTQQKSEVWIPFAYLQFSDLKDLKGYSPPPSVSITMTLVDLMQCYSSIFCFTFRPVVITDILKNWKAMNWTKSFLVRNYGDKRVSMKATEVRRYMPKIL